MQSHTRLDISDKELDKITDKQVEQAYQNALQDARNGNKAQIAQKETALKAAYDELKDEAKRKTYRENLKHPTHQTKAEVTPNPATNQVVATNNQQKIRDAYQKFVDENYKNHPQKEKFKAETHSFGSIKEMQQSKFYQSMGKETQQALEKSFNASSSTNFLVLTFDSKEDAMKFISGMKNQNILDPNSANSALEKLKSGATPNDQTSAAKEQEKRDQQVDATSSSKKDPEAEEEESKTSKPSMHR